jgi:hypothetical protein
VSPLLRRVVSALVVLAALGGVAYACTEIETDDGTNDVAVTGSSPAERLVPPRGSEILRQEAFGIDLKPGWTGVLVLNGVEIPEDQVDDANIASTGELYFTPDDGLAVERYEAGENCVAAIVWRVEDTRADARSVPWCFNVT